MVLRGEVSIYGHRPVSVEFPTPFKTIPEIEVWNINGHSVDFIPSFSKVTPHQVVFKSSTSGGGSLWRNYKWVARGVPMKKVSP